MKKLVCCLILCVTAYFQVAAQKADIYIYRPKAYSSAVLNIQVFVDDKKIGQLSFGERMVYST